MNNTAIEKAVNEQRNKKRKTTKKNASVTNNKFNPKQNQLIAQLLIAYKINPNNNTPNQLIWSGTHKTEGQSQWQKTEPMIINSAATIIPVL